jgi:hypothetical protein
MRPKSKHRINVCFIYIIYTESKSKFTQYFKYAYIFAAISHMRLGVVFST